MDTDSPDNAPQVSTHTRMPPWLPKAMVLALVFFGLFLLADWAFHRLTGLLIVLVVAFFISLAMEPAVAALVRRGLRRGLATAVVFVATFACVLAFLGALVTLLVETATNLAHETPRLLDEGVAWVNRAFGQRFTVHDLSQRLLHESNLIEEYAHTAANNAWGVSTTVLGGLAQVLTIALFSVYLTAGGPKVRRTVCSLLPPARQQRFLHAWDLAIDKTGGYLYSRVVLAIISAVVHGGFLAILGLPNPIALGVWFGVISAFIPTVGTYLAAILPVFVALTVDPLDAVWIIVFAVAYQWLQDYLLQPRITARTVDVNAAIALLSVLAGGALFGAVGALLAIPATATVQAFLSEYVKHYAVTEDSRIDQTTPRRQRTETAPEHDGPDVTPTDASEPS
ncbi:AI-2E family transporter [Nocardia mangyaensis]|uniref:AI-2E family transporter n=1 Tax=Nocardia mangyaensis TaxID=2213200 RepID=A0A1J0VT58_9NOCA|nr:AI-2E family transporter [Nocardia mangyaensis]APE35119.1 AI-2E family transporter [Nocardia mangyaensis]